MHELRPASGPSCTNPWGRGRHSVGPATGRIWKATAWAFSALWLTAAGGSPFHEVTERREPCADHAPLRNPYFGDLHVHTTFSLDASTQGTRNRPRHAYRFARGERLGVQPYAPEGHALRSIQLARPLDFAAVTDHAEMLGEAQICQTPGLPGHDALTCRIYRRWPRAAFFVMNTKANYFETPSRFDWCGPGGIHCRSAAKNPWKEIQEAAEEAHDRTAACEFTTFVGYEWTGSPGSNNIHRNVIFRNQVVPELPITYFEAPQPRRLWEQLQAECLEAEHGCDFLIIPHNSNLSGGRMFQTLRPGDSAITAEEARARAKFEVLVEIMQHKGDSECMPGLDTEDELCGFEKLAMSNFSGRYVSWLAKPPPAMSFTRNALKEGLVQEEKLGVNPFKFGLLASTDTHLGTPGAVAEDETYPGHGGAGTPARDEIPQGLPDAVDFNPGGLAVLWAEENSRDALFAAMRRREAYGTSGPRFVLRFFGGWNYPADLCERHSFAEVGYGSGVPMGADLPRPPAPLPYGGPTFAVSALRDAGVPGRPGMPLQRIQIIKGWLENGAPRERVYDVAGNPTNGAHVDLDTCEPVGRGFDSLCVVWTDPDFDRAERAFYYARVLENPTCRWSTRICVAHGIDCRNPDSIREGFEPCCDPSHRETIQERAWSSPIWYRPAAKSANSSSGNPPPQEGRGS